MALMKPEAVPACKPSVKPKENKEIVLKHLFNKKEVYEKQNFLAYVVEYYCGRGQCHCRCDQWSKYVKNRGGTK